MIIAARNTLCEYQPMACLLNRFRTVAHKLDKSLLFIGEPCLKFDYFPDIAFKLRRTDGWWWWRPELGRGIQDERFYLPPMWGQTARRKLAALTIGKIFRLPLAEVCKLIGMIHGHIACVIAVRISVRRTNASKLI